MRCYLLPTKGVGENKGFSAETPKLFATKVEGY